MPEFTDSHLVVRDSTKKIAFNFAAEANMTGKPAGLWIGRSADDGGGEQGLLFLRNADGKEGIIFDGSNGFSVRDHNGKLVLNFAGEANMTGKPAGLWIGRSQSDGGGPGLVVVRDASGKDSIIIDGSQGDITLANADCAEDFDVDADRVPEIEPGCVVVVDDNERLQLTDTAYDKRVVGVASGAGDRRPGLIMDRRHPSSTRRPVALMGKVNCLVDADIAPIQVGDFLTSSSTLGHAMKATDPLKAFGSVIGKALRPLQSGRRLIPILVALQ
jgi:hypothetical protein